MIRPIAAASRRIRRAAIIAAGLIAGTPCVACGRRSVLISQPVLWPELIAQWELSADWVRYFDQREGTRCGFCDVSLRDRHLAEGILTIAGVPSRSLRDLCRTDKFRALKIAEINAAGRLHQFIRHLPNLAYSEFGSSAPHVRSENLLALSYTSNSFDLVITSETLEHVPDIHVALKETYRVLKPGGWHVFSTPVVWERQRTRQRAALQEAKVINHLPASFHGSGTRAAQDMLVFYEFGSDFTDFCRSAGFELRLLRDPENPALVTFLARKPPKNEHET
jgi:SAM-dependent methyltransferase